MIGHCSPRDLEAALAGHLTSDEEAALHRHLDECEACSAAIEKLAGGDAWSREAATLLATDELDDAVSTCEQWSEIDFTVDHLEPADDPTLLGRLGGYDVLEIIGRGGMGVVLKGYDRELQRCVAIKVLAPHLAQSSLAKKRFAREAQAAAAVVHPHVLAIHQVQPSGKLPFLVMPLVAGESLAERLKTQGRLELLEILRIGMQAAAGFAAAHEQGLVHRDVKPANILLEKGVERAVLTDFGLACAADDVAMTRYGIIAGTPQYMSPEQARGDSLDGRSDLFSLGCVLYEMGTGVSPFRTDSIMATIRRLVDDPPQSPAALNAELPPWFTMIVEKLLEKQPTRRFGSAKEVSELLEGCLAHVQQPASVPLPAALAVAPPPQVSDSRSSRFRGIVVALALFGFGLLGFLAKEATEPPEIAGAWHGAEWGDVALERTDYGEYTGTYSETIGKQPGEIRLKWSRIERRFNGTWREGDDRFGELSVRPVDDEIRGALTTDVKSKINPATPRLADLVWTQSKPVADAAAETISHSALQTELRFVELPGSVVADVTKLDFAALEKLPGAVVLAAPRMITPSGKVCRVQVGGEASPKAGAQATITAEFMPRSALETIHYSIKLDVRSSTVGNDGTRTVIHDWTYSGEASPGSPLIVDIGKGANGRRYVAWMTFDRDQVVGGRNDAVASQTVGPVSEQATREAAEQSAGPPVNSSQGRYSVGEWWRDVAVLTAPKFEVTALRLPLGILRPEVKLRMDVWPPQSFSGEPPGQPGTRVELRLPAELREDRYWRAHWRILVFDDQGREHPRDMGSVHVTDAEGNLDVSVVAVIFKLSKDAVGKIVVQYSPLEEPIVKVPDAAAAMTKPAFGPVIERELKIPALNSLAAVWLDLDRDLTVPIAGFTSSLDNPFDFGAWLRSEGADLCAVRYGRYEPSGPTGPVVPKPAGVEPAFAEQGLGTRGLGTNRPAGLRSMPVKATVWDSTDPDAVLAFDAALLAQTDSDKSLGLIPDGQTPANPKGKLPATFVFKTAEGNMGLLQITGFTDERRSLTLRYKRVP